MTREEEEGEEVKIRLTGWRPFLSGIRNAVVVWFLRLTWRMGLRHPWDKLYMVPRVYKEEAWQMVGCYGDLLHMFRRVLTPQDGKRLRFREILAEEDRRDAREVDSNHGEAIRIEMRRLGITHEDLPGWKGDPMLEAYERLQKAWRPLKDALKDEPSGEE